MINVYNKDTFDFIYKIETGTTNRFIEFTGNRLVTISRTPNYSNSISIWNKENGNKIYSIDYKNIKNTSSFLHDNILYLGLETVNITYRLIAIDISSCTKLFDYKIKYCIDSLCVFKDRLYIDNDRIRLLDIQTRFKPELSIFKNFDLKTKQILWILSLIRERLYQQDYGLPPELWYYILEINKIYELTY